MKTLIKNGFIITSEAQLQGDILIADGRILDIQPAIHGSAEEVIDATGKYVMPGGVDQHVHLNYSYSGQSVRGYESTMAALAGGTTTIGDFVDKYPRENILSSVALYKKDKAEGKACCDFVLHCNLKNPQEEDFKNIALLPKLGISSLNFFMSQNSNPAYCKDDQILRILAEAEKVGLISFVHGENCDVADYLTHKLIQEGKTDPCYHLESRPISIEVESTRRIAYFSQLTQAPVMIVHLSSQKALNVLISQQQKGVLVFGETCPQYLVLDESYLFLDKFESAKYVCNPPLRNKSHQKPLWQGLQNNALLCVGTDHCGFDWAKQKYAGREGFHLIPKGVPGLQDRLALLWTYGVGKNNLSLQDLVRVFSTNPAKILGIYPQKGDLAVGSDGDIVIYDPKPQGIFTNQDSLHQIDYNAYEGLEKSGKVHTVLLRGKTVYAQGKYLGQSGDGQFISAKPFGLGYPKNGISN